MDMTYLDSAVFKHKLPWKREIVKVQSNGVFFIDPTDPESKKSFLAFPSSKEVEFVQDDDCVFVRLFYPLSNGEMFHCMTYKILNDWLK